MREWIKELQDVRQAVGAIKALAGAAREEITYFELFAAAAAYKQTDFNRGEYLDAKSKTEKLLRMAEEVAVVTAQRKLKWNLPLPVLYSIERLIKAARRTQDEEAAQAVQELESTMEEWFNNPFASTDEDEEEEE